MGKIKSFAFGQRAQKQRMVGLLRAKSGSGDGMDGIANSMANEAELRAKVVDVWLRDHGFSSNQIRLEHSFTISLGRSSFTVGSSAQRRSKMARGRADYLVRTTDGRNLFIIEAKAPGTSLDEESRLQAVSYARLLTEGGIAPFAIVTNGEQTQIFDSISGKSLGADAIPPSHPYAIAGFQINGDDFSCRAEALEHLISLSAENLIAFCRGQVKTRMALLRSDSIDSGLKYIPSLYIPRRLQEASLDRLIDGSHQCILVIGPPQVGKTNFICNYVEKQLEQGVPCLFYPAIAQTSGLLEAIRADFEWTFNDSETSAQAVCRKLVRVLDKTERKLLIFVEGLNENREFVKAFNADAERLHAPRITTVLSLTSFSARDILLDEAGNPTFAARSIGVTKGELPILEVNPSNLSDAIALVAIGPYSKEEAELAYAKYKTAFGVDVSRDHQPTHDPLLLRSAMEVYRGDTLPSILNAQAVLERTIEEKLSRSAGISVREGRAIIKEVADRLCSGQIVTDFWLRNACTGAVALMDAAVLVGRGGRAIDFYVTSERSFVVAYWVREWQHSLRGSMDAFKREVLFVSKCDLAREAFRWFMIQPDNVDVLTRIPEALKNFDDLDARKTMALCLCDYLASNAADGFEFGEVEDDAGRDALRDLFYAGRQGDSFISQTLINMIVEDSEQFEIRKLAAIGLAVFDPEQCLSILAQVVGGCDFESEAIFLDTFEPGFRRAADEVVESYYNTRDYMCPSRMDHLEGDEESALGEYDYLCKFCLPAIRIFGSASEASKLEKLLLELNPKHELVKRRADSRLQQSLNLKAGGPTPR